MSKKTFLRQAGVDDLDRLVSLGKHMHQESSFAELNFDVSKVRAEILKCMEHGFMELAVRSNGDGDDGQHIIGAMGGQVELCWFGQDRIATDRFLFVAPGNRGGVASLMLVYAFIRWARACGARQVRPSVSTGCLKADSLYEKLGGVKQGSHFLFQGV